MNAQHRAVIIPLTCAVAALGATWVVRQVAAAFGLANELTVRILLSLVAFGVWTVTARLLAFFTLPACDICGTRPCRAPRCAACGKYAEPTHAQQAREEICLCAPSREQPR